MNDLINRRQAIDAVEQWEDGHTWDDWCNEHKDEKERFHIVPPSDYIRSLPSAEPEQRWMPMTERPLDRGYYLCSVGNSNRVGFAYWTGGSWYGYASDEMTAWMSLPTPWKGEEDED